MPKDCATEIICDRQAAILAIERVAIVANAETGAIAIKYESKTGDISISSVNDSGSAADLIVAETGSKGEDFIITLKSNYALDVFRHVETQLVSMAFNDTRLIKVSPVGMLLHNQLLATIGQPTA